MQQSTFKDILSRELDNRIKQNPGYSLRAFARDIQVDPSNLSKILSGKINPFKKTQERILLDLGFSRKEVSELAESKRKQELGSKNFKDLEVEAFECIAEWHHDAILELTRLSFFKADFKWIAKTLDISEMKVKFAVERMIKLGYLEIREDGKWVDCLGDVSIKRDVNYTNQALKKRQLDILEKSIESVRTIPANERDHSYTMLAVDKEDMQEAKQMIKEFRGKLTQFLERKNVEPNSVYQLHVGFYPLTKKQ